MKELLTSIATKKERLDELRPLSSRALANLEHYYDIELTYTSNAIEGNTLSPVETTLVIEKGITVSGKPLRDHFEALDHYDAIRYVRERARHEMPITEGDVRNLHKLVMLRSAPDLAGQYADLPRVRTETGRYTFPSPAQVPALMGHPPVAVRPEDRLEYIRSLQQEQAGQGAESFHALLYRRLDATLEEYLSALQDAQTPEPKREKSSGLEPKP